MTNLIIFGGTFDPVHNGHLIIAKKLYDLFKIPVTFVPTATPKYKAPPIANNYQRLEMLKLALNSDPRFIIDDSELFSNVYLPSYYSLKKLREQIGFAVPIYFFIGEDSLVTLDSWDNWQELFNLTNFIVALRPGYELSNMSASVQQEFNKRTVANLATLNQTYGQIYLLELAPINISSTQIRANISAKQPIDKLVSSEVASYISINNLYIR